MQNYTLRTAYITIAGILSVAPLSAQEQSKSEFLSLESFYEEELTDTPSIFDPLESVNRVTFQFNDFVYVNVVDPIATGYRAITPDPVERGAENFFDNLRYPVRLAGNLLQGKFEGALKETGRFAVNSTVGIGGIFTPADRFDSLSNIPPEDIGQALGAWGIGEGPYIVLPLFGPSNLRDIGGFTADRAVNPLKEPFSVIDDWEWQLGLGVTEFVVESPAILDRYLQLKGSAIDPYSSVKDGYTQYRRRAIAE